MIIRKEKKRLIAVAVLLAIFLILTLLKSSVEVCEFFATTFSRAWIFVFGHVFSLLPFSFYELFFIVGVCYLTYVVVRLVVLACKKQFGKMLSVTITLALVVLVFLDIYTPTASMSYNRKPLPLIDNVSEFSFEESVKLCDDLFVELEKTSAAVSRDENGVLVLPEMNVLQQLVEEEYKRLDGEYFSPYTPRAKKIINKTVMSEMGLTGVFFAPSGEANVNYTGDVFAPVTVAHELAHSKGVMRESDANITAYYLLLTSDNQLLKYSALVWCYSSAISLVGLYPNSAPTVENFYQRVPDGVRNDLLSYNEYWSKYTLLEDIGEFFNDIYLKLNKQSGVDSYHKPTVIEYTGELDLYGNRIVNIVSFSDVQSMLITLFRNGGF